MFKLLEYRIQTLSNIIKIGNHVYFCMVSYFIFPCIQNYSEFRIIIQNSELFRIMLKTLYLAKTKRHDNNFLGGSAWARTSVWRL